MQQMTTDSTATGARNTSAILARIRSRLDQIEERSTASSRFTNDVKAHGQTQVLLKLMRHDLDDLQDSAERANEETARYRQLAQVMKLLTSSLEMEQVLTDVIDAVIDFLGAERAFLILTDDTRVQPEIRVARNWAQETLTKDEITFSRSIVRQVSQTHEAIVTHSLQRESWLHKIESAALIDVRMVACLPLLVQNRLIGVIYADSRDGRQDESFDTDAASLVLATFADQAAIAIDNARAFGQVRSNLNGAQRQIQHRLMRETALMQKPTEMFQVILRTVSQLLGSSYAALDVLQAGEFKTVATYGEPPEQTETHVFAFQQEIVGRLSLPPLHDRAWMLDHLRQQIAIIVFAIRLSVELQHSREKMVIAREEERRKVRDELHDMIGSRLAVMPILLDLVATGTSEEAKHLLEILKEQVQNVILEIQRFIRQLRPITLDQVGLYGALNQVVHEVASLSQLKVTFTAPNQHAAFSEAVEIAAFRIVNEALANIVRHSGSTECSVRLSLDGDELCIDIADNGRGIAPDAPAGVGLNSMRERAVELGGSFGLESAPGSGTTLRARLPLYLSEINS